MAELPISFSTPPSSAIASYDYEDIAEGTGVTKLYAAISGQGAEQGETVTKTYFLTGETDILSYEIESEQTSAAGPASAADYTNSGVTWDFDLTSFNYPRTVKGTSRFQFSWASKYTGGTAGDNDAKINVRILKYDGTTETVVGSAFTPSKEGVGAAYVVQTSLVSITLTETHFKRGDILRLSFDCWYKRAGSGDHDRLQMFLIGADPLDRDGATITPSTNANHITRMELHIPFRLDDVT